MTTYTVTSNADSGAGSLRNTIGTAADGDLINFAPGVSTILLSSTLAINRSVTIEGHLGGGTGAPNVTIDGQGKVADINIQPFAKVTLDGLIIQNGFDGDTLNRAGGVTVQGTLNLSNSILRNNNAFGVAAGNLSGTTGSVNGESGFSGENAAGGIYVRYGAALNLYRQSNAFYGNYAKGGNGGRAAGSGNYRSPYDPTRSRYAGGTGGLGGRQSSGMARVAPTAGAPGAGSYGGAGGTEGFGRGGSGKQYGGSLIGAGGGGVGGSAFADIGGVGTVSTVCFVSGTHIRVVRDAIEEEVAVEDLKIGDLAVTASGAHRPIRWIGHRAYAGRFANANPDLLPVCIKADALADGVPARDLWVSPKHALYLDGALIPAAVLVNGVSIVKATRVDDIAYWHVELDSHDVILAENAPAESFVDDAGRNIFQNARTFYDLYPDAVPVEALYCAPRLEYGHTVAEVKRRLARRAGLDGARLASFGTLRGRVDLCDDSTIAGWAQDSLYPDAPVCLDVHVDGELVMLTYADLPMPGLESAGIGDGPHGFSIELQLTSDVPHRIEVRRSADAMPLPGSPLYVAAAARATAA